MSKQGRNVVEIEKCPHCGNHIGFYATADTLTINPGPNRDYGQHKMRVDGAGVTCTACNSLLLPSSEIPCVIATK